MLIRLLLKLLINAVAVYIVAKLLPGIHLADFTTAIVVSILLGFINAFIKPLLIFLTLPITIITLGLFVFVINGIIVLFVGNIVSGFRVDGFLWAALFSLLLSIVNGILFKTVK